MQKFLKVAEKYGFTGYVCFKVGDIGCANGMWAYVNESDNGFSPSGDVMYHSFVDGRDWWSVKINDEWSPENEQTYDVMINFMKERGRA